MTPAQIAVAQERAASWQPATSEAETETSEAETGTSEVETATSEAKTETSEASPTTSEADPGPPPERAIREAQSLLNALGYEVEAADGVWNEVTASAYQQFLIDANQPPSEVLTPAGLRAMRSITKRRVGDGRQTGRPVRRDAVALVAKAGEVDGLQKALAAGADVDASDARGWTALMYAADKGYILLIEPLLAAGADPDIHLADGATALFMAAVRGHTEVIAALMKAGADPSIKGPRGKTATEVARIKYGEADDFYKREIYDSETGGSKNPTDADRSVYAFLQGYSLCIM